jgi:hypothetical protein
VTGDEVEVEVEIDVEPRVVVEPADFARALNADPVARATYDRLSYSRKRELVLAIESGKKAETRIRLIEKTLAGLRDHDEAIIAQVGSGWLLTRFPCWSRAESPGHRKRFAYPSCRGPSPKSWPRARGRSP